jgi:NodT family efflux transporter outer membrane factor (OMF) lipoprotein
MKLSRLGLLVSLLLLLTSCATAPEKTKVENLPTPAAWTAAPAETAGMLDHWWTSFGSTNLNAVVEEAMVNNHDLKQALARVDAALAQARIAGADRLPEVGFSADAGKRQQVFVGLPIPGKSGPLKSKSTAYTALLNVSWELDVWGRIRSGQSAAMADVQASEEDYRGAMESLAAQTVQAWLAVVAAQRQLQLAEATVASFTLTSEQVGARYRRGLRTALDYRLALNSAASARALLAQRRRELQTARRQLETLLGRYPANRTEVEKKLPELTAPVPAGLPSDLLEGRPDLVAGERRLAATLARVKEAKRSLLPRISLTASGGRSSSDLSDLLDSDFNMWTLGANLAQPLFQGGRLRANVKLSEARAREALEHYHSLVLRAFREVETALASETDLAARETAVAEAARQSREALRLAQERYFAGLIDFVTVTESQRNAYNAETELILVRQQRLANRVDLYLALGGGFDTNAPVRMAATEQ